MAVIGSPLNQRDVQGALGVSTSVNKWSQLCTHSNINMWSAYKPMYATKITRLTDAERANPVSQGVRPAISGYTISWGIRKRISSSWSDFMDNYGAIKSAPWIYDKPVSDGSSKFRITDYIGYNHSVRRVVAVSYNSWDLWIPSAAGSAGYSLWAQLTGKSTVSSENTNAMRWQELFGDHLNYYPTLIMTAGTGWQYSKSSDYTIQNLIARGDTGATIYVNTATLASAMVADGASYGHYPLSNSSSWTMTMVLCSSKVTGEAGVTQHKIPSGANILRLEYASGADRTTKTAKELKYRAFSSMKAKATLVKESGSSYKYRLDKLEIIAEKLTEDAVYFNCDFTLTAQVGTVNVTGKGQATGGASLKVTNYLGTINYAAGETGTITRTWQYNATSGNSIPYTTYDITTPQPGSGERQAYGNFAFTAKSGTTTIGTFSGGWESINVNSQNYSYTREFTLF